MFDALRRRIWLPVTCAVLGGAVVMAFVRLRGPTYRARVTIQFPGITGKSDSAASTSNKSARPIAIDPVLSELLPLESRDVIGDVVDAQGLRLINGPGDLQADNVHAAQVATADSMSSRISLTFGEGIEAESEGSRVSGPYGAPMEVGGVSFTIRRRPDVGSAEMIIATREAAIDSILRHVQAGRRGATNGADIDVTSPDSTWSVNVANGLIGAFALHRALASASAASRSTASDSSAAIARSRQSSPRARHRRRVPVAAPGNPSASSQQIAAQRRQLESERTIYRDLITRLHKISDGADGLQVMASLPSDDNNQPLSQLYTTLLGYELTRDSLTAGPWGKAVTHPDVVRVNELIETVRSRLGEILRARVGDVERRMALLDQAARSDSAASRDAAQSITNGTFEGDDRLPSVPTVTPPVSEASAAHAPDTDLMNVLSVATYATLIGGDRTELWIAGGVGAGLLIGLIIVIATEAMNTSIRHPNEIQTMLGVPNLAVVPFVARIGAGDLRHATSSLSSGTSRWLGSGLGRIKPVSREDAELEMLRPLLAEGTSTEWEETNRIAVPVDEAYRTLRTNLSFSAGELELTTFVITSPSPDEGKSATAWGLAGAFVEQGKSVVLLDGDMRNSSLADTLGINASPGLAEVLQGTVSLRDTVCGAFAIDVVPSGARSSNALHLLSSPIMTQVLMELTRDYDAVVIDAPSIHVAADATVIGARVDGAVLVLQAGKTQRRRAEYAIQQMSNARVRVLGTVLNDPSD